MQIIIVIEETKKDGDEKDIVGETEIDLDELMRKLKYYTIGNKDKILQGEFYVAKKRKKQEEGEKISTIILQPITGKDSFVKEESSLKASLKLKPS